MRTPEKIKKGLECCAKNVPYPCAGCPYKGTFEEEWSCKLHSDALAYTKQLEAQVPKWISVEERLPDDDRDVLVCVNGNTIDTGYCTFGHGGNRYWTTYAAIRNNVTHWMPLPEPPKEDA